MFLPELSERVIEYAKAIYSGFGAQPVTLGLKGIGDWDPQWYARNGFYGIAANLAGSSPAWSGERVTLDSALSHSVVFTCNRIIAESVGFLPLIMMRQNGGVKIEATDKVMFSALQNAPNEEVTAQGFRETTTGHCVLGGNGYAQIIRRSGTGEAQELLQLLPSQVTPDREKTGERRIVYVVKEGNLQPKTYTVEKGKPQDILHIPGIGWDGLRGYSVLAMARQSIGTALAAERHVGRFYARGGRLPYNLKLSQVFENDEDAKKFRAEWNEIASNPNEAPILEPWLEYQSTGLSLRDSQMLESRQFTVPEICRWFRISPHMAGDLSNANNSITEQLALEFVTFTLSPWLKRWEQQLWRCVLTPQEKKQGYFWRHNVNALLRGDFITRMQGYSIALQNGFRSQNEVRDLEDLPPFEGGDNYHIQLNLQALPSGQASGAAGPGTPNQLVRLNNGSKYLKVA